MVAPKRSIASGAARPVRLGGRALRRWPRKTRAARALAVRGLGIPGPSPLDAPLPLGWIGAVEAMWLG